MVHNGIEYVDMQLICEVYDILHRGLGMDPKELHETFAAWDKSELNSYLIEITAEIFLQNDTDGKPLLDKILDAAGQKGTGKWTVNDALDNGVPLTLISEAVFSRFLSSFVEERKAASKILKGPDYSMQASDRENFIADLRKALYAAKIISYAQGFMLLKEASQKNGWKLNFGGIALMWRGGCIIRSRFLGEIKKAYAEDSSLENLLTAPYFAKELAGAQQSLRNSVSHAAQLGIPIPCLSAALSFYDGYRSARLPANLLQAQRDFFGAHTYERLEKPRGQFFHTKWSSES
jgi:6-phosphogluconate dehydrogenase